MTTLEEIIREDMPIIGKGKKADFVVSAKYKGQASQNAWFVNFLQELMNKKLKAKKYSNIIEHLTIIHLLLPPYNGQGVNWQERKYFKRSEKHFYIDIRISDYDRFCNATREEALKILAQETLRGIEKFLTKVKDFDFPKFYVDVKELFEKEFGN